ncbi:MAG: DUF4199 domain-containing protein [Ignavibacteriales bacterium]|nr:DUF4199 domain-containing protein [Ignavibacteriales bacterium]
MNTTLKYGLILGLLCSAWTYVMGFTGWYIDPVMMNMFYAVILFEIIILYFALKETASTKTYGGQVVNGLLVSVYGGIIIFVSSMIFTSVVFPNYFNDLNAAYSEMLRNEGLSEEAVTTAMQAMAPMQTSMMQAVMGFVGTVGTALVASLIIAIFQRKQ